LSLPLYATADLPHLTKGTFSNCLDQLKIVGGHIVEPFWQLAQVCDRHLSNGTAGELAIQGQRPGSGRAHPLAQAVGGAS
jgi:hypothetical protein